jgi:hypothetical protein
MQMRQCLTKTNLNAGHNSAHALSYGNLFIYEYLRLLWIKEVAIVLTQATNSPRSLDLLSA